VSAGKQGFARGAASVELLVGLGIFLTLGLGGFQWGVLYEAKANASHAAFVAARRGAMTNADPAAMRLAFAEALAPFFAPASRSDADRAQVITGTTLTEANAFTRLRILNPTAEVFNDFAEDVDRDGRAEELPNVDLDQRPTTQGGSSGVNIQDANLLKVEFTYGVPLNMPVISDLFALIMRGLYPDGSFERDMLANNRMPVTATSMVRMQTFARRSDEMVSLDAGERALNATRQDRTYAYDNVDRPNIFVDGGDGTYSCSG
jgi:hypothetical protein